MVAGLIRYEFGAVRFLKWSDSLKICGDCMDQSEQIMSA